MTDGVVGHPSAGETRCLLEAIPGCEASGPGSTSVRWWTRQERCRTAGELTFEAPLLGTEPVPRYQRMARDASHLHQLGLSVAAVARRLRADHKTAAKAIRWREKQI